jgi:hypothetical protein
MEMLTFRLDRVKQIRAQILERAMQSEKIQAIIAVSAIVITPVTSANII